MAVTSTPKAPAIDLRPIIERIVAERAAARAKGLNPRASWIIGRH